jgi:protein-S-isoprenylcysteine O-methyltransferase Ste14
LVGGIGILAALALALLSTPPVPEDTWLDEGLDILAWIVFIGGGGVRFWATLYIGGRKEWTLVSEGPYSICRNPLYVGSFLMLLSFAIFLDSATFAAVAMPVVIAYMIGTVRAEEQVLHKTLGEEYARYCERVPRFWPRLSQYHTPDVTPVRVKGMRIECVRMLRWFLVPLSMEVVSHLRECAWWPHLLRLP